MLNTLSFFSDLSNQELENLSKITTEVSYRRGEVIFGQGDLSRDFFIIKHGQVEIYVMNIFHEKKVLNILKNGEFFGDMALFDKNSARLATALAFQNTTLYKIAGPEFERLLKEQPSISFKLLGTMSKRLKEAIDPGPDSTSPKVAHKMAKVLTICSPRSGYGKSTMAATIAHIIAGELPRKVLFVDLDLNYGDGTFLMGVYSPRSIVNLAAALQNESTFDETIEKFTTRKLPNLSVLAAPKDMIDAERLHPDELVKMINACRKYFDYLIIDTNSFITDHLLNALDMSDKILFLINLSSSVAIKSNTLFFQAIDGLSLPESHVHLTLSHTNQAVNIDHYRKIMKWPINGQIPTVEGMKLEAASLPYLTEPEGEYCQSARMLIKTVLGEDTIHVATDAGYLSRWFSSPKIPKKLPTLPDETGMVGGDSRKKLDFSGESFGPLLKEIKVLMAQGFLDQAQEKCSDVVDICPGSPSILQVLGEIFFMKRDFAHALEIFSKVYTLDPDNYIAAGFLAYLKGDEQLQAKAMQMLTGKIQKSPDFPDLLNEMGKMLMMCGNPKDGRVFFEKALGINPAYAEARMNLALSLGEDSRDGEAIEQLMKIESKTVKVYYLLGNYLFNTGKFFDSMAAYTRVTEINPHYLDTDERLTSLSDYFAKLNNLIEMHKRLVRESPNFPDIHFKMGNLYLMAGKNQEAEVEFKEALNLKPAYVEAQNKLVELKKEWSEERTKSIENGEISTSVESVEMVPPKANTKENQVD